MTGDIDVKKKGEKLSRKVIYESSWLNLYVDRVRLPNDHIIEAHHVLELGAGSVSAVIEDSRGRVLLVRLYRYPSDSFEWELPAGRVEEGETPLESIQREVLEETGYRAVHYEEMLAYYPVTGVSNHRLTIFRCRAAERVGTFDAREISEVRWYEKEELRRMIQVKEIKDGLSLIGLLYHLSFPAA